MSPIFMRALFAVFLAVMLSGCATGSISTKTDLSRVKPCLFPLPADDVAQVFTPAFATYRWFAKGKFETQEEYDARLKKTGLEGKEVTFCIPPELCNVIAYPDSGSYVVIARDALSANRNDKSDIRWAITVAQTANEPRQITEVNRFGLSREVKSYTGTKYMVRIEGFTRLPLALRWKEDGSDSFIRFGLPLKTFDPTLRMLLQQNKIGLAVHGRLGNPALSEQTSREYAGRPSEGVSSSYDIQILSFWIEDAYVYRADTREALMHWSLHQ